MSIKLIISFENYCFRALNYLFWVKFIKNYLNISLVEVQNCKILKKSLWQYFLFTIVCTNSIVVRGRYVWIGEIVDKMTTYYIE